MDVDYVHNLEGISIIRRRGARAGVPSPQPQAGVEHPNGEANRPCDGVTMIRSPLHHQSIQ